MKQRYSNLEIAKVAYCSESTVKKAVERGLGDGLEELIGWVLIQRLKVGGLGGLEGLVASGKVRVGVEVPAVEKKAPAVEEDVACGGTIVVPDYSHEEGNW